MSECAGVRAHVCVCVCCADELVFGVVILEEIALSKEFLLRVRHSVQPLHHCASVVAQLRIDIDDVSVCVVDDQILWPGVFNLDTLHIYIDLVRHTLWCIRRGDRRLTKTDRISNARAPDPTKRITRRCWSGCVKYFRTTGLSVASRRNFDPCQQIALGYFAVAYIG